MRAGRVSPRKPGGSPTGTPLNSPPGSPGSPRGSVVSKGSSVGMIRSLSPSRLSPMKIRPKSPSRKKKKDPATISKSFSTDHCSLPALSIDYRGIRRGWCFFFFSDSSFSFLEFFFLIHIFLFFH